MLDEFSEKVLETVITLSQENHSADRAGIVKSLNASQSDTVSALGFLSHEQYIYESDARTIENEDGEKTVHHFYKPEYKAMSYVAQKQESLIAGKKSIRAERWWTLLLSVIGGLLALAVGVILWLWGMN